MLLQNIKKGIYRFDLFYSEQLLRYNSDTQYKTLTGGILSLIIITAILVGFASMISDTFNKTSITSSLTVTKQSDPPFASLQTGSDNMFMFSLQVQSLDASFIANLSQIPQYFNIQMAIVEQNYGNVVNVIPSNLNQCTRQHWNMMPEFQRKFSDQVSGWLCLPLNYQIPLQGVFSSPTFQFAVIQVSKCSNYTSNNTCAPQEQIDALFKNYTNFYLNFNYVNTVINPNQPDFISYYIQSNDYVVFSENIGSQTWVFFSDYTITTDNSILPYTDVSKKTGLIVEETAVNHPYGLTGDGSPLVRVFFAKSVNSLAYGRQVQKISAVLSYIGGLVGAVTAFLFLIKSYTDSSLQITIAFNLFEQKKNEIDAEAQPKSNFNIFTYTVLMFYKFLKAIGWKKPWNLQKKLQVYQREALNQLDVQLIIKRLIKIQSCLSQFIGKKQIESIKMQKEITVEIAKKMRELFLQSEKSDQNSSNKQQLPESKTRKDMQIQIYSVFQNSEGQSQIQSGVVMRKNQMIQNHQADYVNKSPNINDRNVNGDNMKQDKMVQIKSKMLNIITKNRSKTIKI